MGGVEERRGRVIACAALLGAGLLLGPRPVAAEPPRTAAVKQYLTSAETARESGDLDFAERALLSALALEPDADDVRASLSGLRDDADLRTLWALDTAETLVDERGKFKRPRRWSSLAKDDAALVTALVKERARVVRSAAAAAKKLRSPLDAPVLAVLDGIARLAAGESPALRAHYAEQADAARERLEPDPDAVTSALSQLMKSAFAEGDDATALAAARVLRGLYQQRGQEDAKQRGVGDSSEIADVQRVIDAVRRKQKEAEGAKVWTIDELLAIPEEERPAWNAKHGSWARPGVALSTTGKYRIETICGLETLLVAADEVELHHARLVDWFGSDPCKDRPGLIRLCPDVADMEREGQPFWWAGGWQRGDVTVALVRFSDNASLGSLLTHELTHRFDGLAHPLLPAWISEGRAVYSEICSPNPGAPKLDERMYDSTRLWDAHEKGYGRPDNFQKLLAGDLEDYRHNYFAGYGLWLFLERFQSFDSDQDGTPLYRAKLPAYLKSFRDEPGLDATARFRKYLLDGKDGRAKDLRVFCNSLYRFWVQASQGGEPPEWRRVWDERQEEARRAFPRDRRRFIYDAPTSARTRNRHDRPDVGRGHALAAGRLLLAHGKRKAALEAYAWAVRVEELTAAELRETTEALSEEVKGAVAWSLAHRAHRLDRTAATPDGAPDGALDRPWESARDLATWYAEQVPPLDEAKRTTLSKALRAEHDLLAEWLGLPLLASGADADAKDHPGLDRPGPRCPPHRGALLPGVFGERWTPLDSRPDAPWHQPSPGQLELGRKEAADAATGAVRDAHVRRVFVRSNERYAGTYTIRTRVRFLSAFAEARLVLGHDHRDGGLQVKVTGGDWNYAVGETEKGHPLRFVNVGVNDFRPFDYEQSPLHTNVGFDTPRQAFDLVVHVSGPFVRVMVDGQEAVTHRRVTNEPLEGHVGFALYRGIVRFEEPTIRRHRAAGPDRRCACGAFDEPFSLERATGFSWSTAVGRRVEGLPRSPAGTLLFWYDEKTPAEARIGPVVKSEMELHRTRLRKAALPIAIRLAVPALDSDEKVSPTLRFPPASKVDLPKGHVHRHAGHAGLGRALEDMVDRWAAESERRNPSISKEEARERARAFLLGAPTWILIDDRNVIRACSPETSHHYLVSLAHRLAGW